MIGDVKVDVEKATKKDITNLRKHTSMVFQNITYLKIKQH